MSFSVMYRRLLRRLSARGSRRQRRERSKSQEINLRRGLRIGPTRFRITIPHRPNVNENKINEDELTIPPLQKYFGALILVNKSTKLVTSEDYVQGARRTGRTDGRHGSAVSPVSMSSAGRAFVVRGCRKLRMSVNDVDTFARVSASKMSVSGVLLNRVQVSACRASGGGGGALLRLGRVRRVHGGDGGGGRRTHLLQVAGAVELQAALCKPHLAILTNIVTQIVNFVRIDNH